MGSRIVNSVMLKFGSLCLWLFVFELMNCDVSGLFFGSFMNFEIVSVNSGFVMIVVGMLMMRLKVIVLLILVLYCWMVSSVVGCGGISLCMIDRLVIIGRLMMSSDLLVCFVMLNVIGISSMKLILKNIGRLMMIVMNIIV